MRILHPWLFTARKVFVFSLEEIFSANSPDLDSIDGVGLETVERSLTNRAVHLLLARVVPAGRAVRFVEDRVASDGGLVVSRGHPGQVGRPAGVVQHHQLGNLVRDVLANNIKSMKHLTITILQTENTNLLTDIKIFPFIYL